MKKLKEDSLISKILIYLGETSKDLLVLSAKIMFDPHSLCKGMGLYQDYSRSYLSKNFSYLKKKQYHFQFKNNKLYLTPQGRIEIIRLIIKNKRKNKESKWDKKWRAIIFDIPELTRRSRDFLRRELKWLGFKELQKSIWIYPFDIEKELKTLLKLWKRDFRGDIRFILIEKIDDKDLRKYFGLK